MPLQIAEVTLTVNPGPGGYQSIPPLNSLNATLHGAGQAHWQMLIGSESLDINEKEKKAGEELCYEHAQVGFGLSGQYLDIRSHLMKAAAKQHTELAIMTLFGAIIKIILVQVIAPYIPGFSDIPAVASAAIDTFSFGALAFDLLGAASILISARILLRTATEANSLRNPKLNVRLGHAQIAPPLPGSGVAASSNSPDGALGLYLMDDPIDISFGASMLCIAGAAFFSASPCIILITTQPAAVWVPTMMGLLVISTMFWFWTKRGEKQWEEVTFQSGSG